MQVFRQVEAQDPILVGWGVRVLMLGSDHADQRGCTARRLAGIGGIVETEGDVFAALETAMTYPTGYGLFVVDCDNFGGLEAGRNIVRMLRQGDVAIPVILVSKDCSEQKFPYADHQAVELRAPLSAVALRVGLDHALRHRLVYQAA